MLSARAPIAATTTTTATTTAHELEPEPNPHSYPNLYSHSNLNTTTATAAAASHQPVSYLPHNMAVEDQTLSNTLANTHIASPAASDGLYPPNRQPKFNEEWDASVRGSSVVDGYHHYQQRQRSQSPNVSAVQRANSVSSRSEVITGDGTSAHGISLSRGNTLKKKNSLRRSASLKRSGSRRSMKAGSVRSLALQSSHEPDEMHSAFYCPVPTLGTPTDVLAQRFQGV